MEQRNKNVESNVGLANTSSKVLPVSKIMLNKF